MHYVLITTFMQDGEPVNKLDSLNYIKYSYYSF